MQAPPPPMMSAPMMMDRRKMGVGLLIVFGLLFLAAGAILVDASNQQLINPTPEQVAAQNNLGLFIGPAVAHFGMFLLLAGLLGAAVFLEDMDVFVRLFLLILAFVALLLVLASSPTIFG